VGQKTQTILNTSDLLVLDAIHREQHIPDWVRDRLSVLRNIGVIERVGRKYILSGQFYKFVGRKGVYTRKKGLDRETNKALLIKHIEDNKAVGSRFSEFKDVLPSLTRDQTQTLLREMKKDGHIFSVGKTRGARWYPGTESNTR
jgi:ATP-dependent DNA helicase RecG